MDSFKYFGSKQMYNWPSLFSLKTRLFNHSVDVWGFINYTLFSISSNSFLHLSSISNGTSEKFVFLA